MDYTITGAITKEAGKREMYFDGLKAVIVSLRPGETVVAEFCTMSLAVDCALHLLDGPLPCHIATYRYTNRNLVFEYA